MEFSKKTIWFYTIIGFAWAGICTWYVSKDFELSLDGKKVVCNHAMFDDETITCDNTIYQLRHYKEVSFRRVDHFENMAK